MGTLQAVKTFIAALAFTAALLSPFRALSHDNCRVILSGIKDTKIRLEMKRGPDVIGMFEFKRISDEEAEVSNIYLFSGFRRQGLSKLFLAEMVNGMPLLERVNALLIRDNLSASGLYLLNDVTEDQCKDGILRTPFYKALAPMGFREISKCYYNPRSHFLTVQLSR